MKKEIFDSVKNESKYIGILFLIVSLIFKIVYFKENLFVVLRMVLSLFWLFVLPGYFIMLYWKEKLDFTERMLVGIAVSAAIIGVFSYYIGLLGLNMKFHPVLLPLLIMIIGFVAAIKKA